MDLATQQKQLLGLIKGTYTATAGDDAYILKVAGSPQLAMVREIALWWRQLSLEKYCILTSRMLKTIGRFDELVGRFFASTGACPFIEDEGERFLQFVTTESMSPALNAIQTAMARFELSLLSAKRGEAGEWTIDWPCHPGTVLNALLSNDGDATENVAGNYRTITSRQFPELFQVINLDEAHGDDSAGSITRV
jgi:hypothetical protein